MFVFFTISKLLSVCCILNMSLVKIMSGILLEAERACAFWYYFRAGGDGRPVYLYMEEITGSISGAYLTWHYLPSSIEGRENAESVLF